MPDLYKEVDFTKGYEFLDGELNRIKIKSKTKNRRSDKLVKLYLKNGLEQYLLVHIEVQGYFEEDFSKRMFKYFYRISDLHNTYNITAISIYTEDDKNFKPNNFKHSLFGTELIYKFNTYKVLDQIENELKKSSNIFSLVVLAVLYSLKAKDNQKKKLEFKIKLTKLLSERNYEEKEIVELFDFINLFLNFKDQKYDILFDEELEKMPRTKEKAVLNSFDKYMIKKNNQKTKEIAKNFKNKNFSLKDISDATGLSIEDIEKL